LTPEPAARCTERSPALAFARAVADLASAAGFLAPADQDAAIDCLVRLFSDARATGDKSRDRPDGAAPCSPPVIEEWVRKHGPLTRIQGAILAALDGAAMSIEDLAFQTTSGDTSRLYKAGLKSVLAKGGLVRHLPGLGYYRPDRPPMQLP
jgi:hypothetical protein